MCSVFFVIRMVKLGLFNSQFFGVNLKRAIFALVSKAKNKQYEGELVMANGRVEVKGDPKLNRLPNLKNSCTAPIFAFQL